MALLEYDFSVVGVANIDKAFASIEKRAAQHNARMNRTFGVRGTGASAGAPAMARSRAADPVKEAARATLIAERQVAREKTKNERFLQNLKNRHFQEEERNRNKADRWRQNMRNRHFQQEERKAARAASLALRERQQAAKGMVGAVGRSAGGSLRAVGALGGTALAIGGGFAVSNAIQTQMSEGAQASKLANQAGDPALKSQLLKESRGVRGFTGGEAMAGMGEFVTKTGDLESARDLIKDMGELALATDTDLGDLGATAGQAFNVLADSIQDPAERLKALKELLGTLAVQGAMGAVEMKDLAKDFGKLGAATRAFEGGGPELLRTMGAFAQMAVARGGAESSADASTAAARLSNDIVTNRKKFAGLLGSENALKSKTDSSKLRNPLEIMLDVLDKTGGDVMKTGGLFGAESGKIFKGLSAVYTSAEAQQKGSGRAAVEREFGQYAGAKLDDTEIRRRADSRMGDPDLIFKETMKEFNTVLGTELLPTVTKLIPEFTKLIPVAQTLGRLLGKFVEGLVDNPLSTIGQVIAAKVAWDIASARIGSTIKDGLSRAMSSAGPIKVDGKGVNMSGAVLNGAALGVTGAMMLYASGVVNFEQREAADEALGKQLNEVRGLKGDNPESLKRAREVLGNFRKQQLEDSKPGVFESIFGAVLGAANSVPVTLPDGSIAPSRYDSEATSQAARSVAQGVGAAPSEASVQFANSGETELLKEMRRLEKEAADTNSKAAEDQKLAAETMLKAAQIASAGGGPNRGNTPSPVKG